MIHVERPEGPAVLTEPDGKGMREAKKAVASFLEFTQAHPDQAAEWKFDFKAYKHKDVKAALETLFHGKCAYCESNYRGTQPVDVEHWRPKGQTVPEEGAKPLKPAYYWLAADWQNLLPSCIDCNRKRRQYDVVEDKTVSIGKKDEFPLHNPAKRTTAPRQKGDPPAEEVPLLLDPCTDDPADFLEFDPDGRGVLRPKESSGLALARANQSIRVYGLNRIGLVMNRQELTRRLELRIATIKALARILIEDEPLAEHIRLIIDQRMMAELRELARARRPDQPFSLLARELIDRHMEELEVLALGDDLD